VINTLDTNYSLFSKHLQKLFLVVDYQMASEERRVARVTKSEWGAITVIYKNVNAFEETETQHDSYSMATAQCNQWQSFLPSCTGDSRLTDIKHQK
jgi:hypothetical protein